MPRMTSDQVERLLAAPHVGVLSVNRSARGPIAVPMWFLYRNGVFRLITSADSLHGRVMQRTGRATLTVHSEEYGEDGSVENYVIAEGPIVFTDDDVVSEVYEMRAKYYTHSRGREWVDKPIPPETMRQEVAILHPEKLSGFEWTESIGKPTP